MLDPKEEAARKARIKELLDQMEQACANINRLAKKRIAEIDAEIAQLKAQDVRGVGWGVGNARAHGEVLCACVCVCVRVLYIYGSRD